MEQRLCRREALRGKSVGSQLALAIAAGPLDRQRRAELAARQRGSAEDGRSSFPASSAAIDRPRNGTLGRHTAALTLSENDPLPFHTSPRERYHISDSERHYENIYQWVGAPGNRDDKALKV